MVCLACLKEADMQEDVQENESESTLVSHQIPSLGLFDWILAAVAAALVFIGLSFLSFPGLHPDAWKDAAVAAGLRPPSELFPGLWRVIVAALYSGGAKTGTGLVVFAGRFCAGVTAGFVYLLFRVLVAEIARFRLRYAESRHAVQRIAAFCGAIFFACSDPMWRAGQAFTPAGLLTLLTILAVFMFVQFLLNGHFLLALGGVFLTGLLAAETPFGFILLAICWRGYMIAYRRGACNDNNPLLDRGAGQSARWLLSFVWIVGLVGGIALNCISFIKMGSLPVLEKTAGDIPLMYAVAWWHTLIGAANHLGWLISLIVCVLPAGLALFMLPRAVDEERLLPYHTGTVAFFSGGVAFCQLAMLSPLWFWNWTSSIRVNSPFFLQLLVLCASCTVVCSLVVFGVEACCRDHSRLQKREFARLSPTGRFVLFVVSALILIAAVLPGRTLRRTRQMLAVINDYANEVVDECGPASRIFTNGSFDSFYELIAAARNRKLYALSIMAGSTAYERNLRMRGVLDAEDQSALTASAGAALRVWMREKPERLKECAIQLGFELWKHEGRELPVCSGVLARPTGMDAAECAKGVANARALAKRILDIYSYGTLDKAAGKSVTELFRHVQWRIARIARMRAERADRAGDAATAEADMKLSQDLDDCNGSLQKILADMERARATSLHQVTPREGLQLALARGNFFLAEGYARTILKAMKDDPDAHFAMGMYYVKQSQWARAEEHLKAYAAKRPKQPVVWNNLAMVCLKMNRFNEAEQHAKKALELIPESAEVKDTIKQIEEAKKAAAAPKASAKEGK